jgi:cytosine/adenosine deaminase-related metal-dependent hydrolase
MTRTGTGDARNDQKSRGSQALYRAGWVLPVAGPPIRDGWVAVRDGRIDGVGGGAVPAGWSAAVREVGPSAILPGLVNAHTHLELSALRGRVPRAASMPVWVCDLLAARRPGVPPPGPIAEAIAEAHRSGTVLVGDISNTMGSVAPLRASPVSAVVFRELLGFSLSDPGRLVREAGAAVEEGEPAARVRVSLAVHAPYSSSPGLFRAVAAWVAASDRRVTSVHLAESPEELRFLQDGTGPWRTLLETLGAWNPAWQPPGGDPAAYLDGLGMLGPQVLAVHGGQLDDAGLDRLRRRGATLVTCPRSNQWVGAGPPPLERFYRSGVRVALGTDSLASVADLNLFAEMAEVRRLAAGVPARAIIDSATRVGAAALGFAGQLGELTPGARAALLAVDVPAGITDVEEYLVGGVESATLRWLEE